MNKSNPISVGATTYGGPANSIRPGASAVIFDARGYVLLQQRSDNGLWGLPGGTMEVGERADAAVVREVWEETGLHAEPVRLIGVYSDPALGQTIRYPDGNAYHFVSLVFECRVVGGELLAEAPETLATGWFDPANLPADIVPPHPIRIQDALARQPEAFFR